MAIVIDKNTKKDFIGRTTVFQGNPNYLVLTRNDLGEYKDLKSRNIFNKYWKIVGGVLEEMDPTEKLGVDSSELIKIKEIKVKKLRNAAHGYIQSKYPLEWQTTISYLMAESRRLGLIDRFNYFNKVGEWCKTILGDFFVREVSVNAATNKQEVESVSLDFTSFDVTDPKTQLNIGMTITT